MGKFITIEGLEGMGKSTVIKAVCHHLEQHNIKYVLTREPGGTELGEQVRELLLAKRDEYIAPLTEAFLFFAGRQQNINEIIKPTLEKGQWVICDRFTDSSLAYQGGGRGVPMSMIRSMQQWVQQDLSPDMTLLLDAPVEIGMERIEDRSKDRIEAENKQFFERAREVYMQLAQDEPERYKRVAADQSPDQVKSNVIQLLNEVMQQ